MRLSPLACAAALVAVSGCNCGGHTFIVTDSFTPPPGDFDSAPDALHDYVVGTEIGLDIRAARLFVDMNAVKVVSKNPELLEVEEQSLSDGVIHAKLHALKAGTAGLDFLDARQSPLEERVIEVKQPDEIALDVNIDRDHGYTIPVIDTENMLVAVDGAVTFRVTYKTDGHEVKGVGVLVGSSSTVTLQNPVNDAPDREFLKIVAPNAAADAAPVELSVADIVVTTLTVRVADASEIAKIELDEGDLPSFKNNGDVFTVWGKAFNEDAAPVFGAPFAWTFDSKAIDGDGDLVSYTYQGGERRRIQVRAGDAVEDLTVEAKDGTAQIGSTESTGCAAGAGAPPLVVLAALALVRRRRARA